jgi:hypothetical protein
MAGLACTIVLFNRAGTTLVGSTFMRAEWLFEIQTIWASMFFSGKVLPR